ncbi:MAG: 2Fe-2S iron-sulfur cluster binding domain-containing protein [Gammaproteobacteria bacterium]|nr:2Fe-2S iron-sulfur cluster binding domain-containing protein [Gammaproteobacteria bacterium]
MKVAVRTKQQNYAVTCAEGERILYAALREGIPLPYECATGTCGTCKARARPGDVHSEWPEAPGNVYLKPERGEFLMCQSIARGDCEILVPGKPAPAAVAGLRPSHHKGILQNLHSHTHDVVTFAIALDAPVSFHSGQFAVMESDDVQGYRAYSMVNVAGSAECLSFVVKRKPDGRFSNWLFDAKPAGQHVRLFGPLGRATFDPRERKNVIAIAGGSGIAGIVSILAHATDSGHFDQYSGQVYFGVRGARDVFFLDRLSDFVQRANGALNVTVALSDEDPPPSLMQTYPQLRFAGGMVHLVAGEGLAGHYDDSIAYVAGPPAMVDGALRLLIVKGRMPATSIRYDKFG